MNGLDRALVVRLGGRDAGRLVPSRRGGSFTFAYSPDWLASPAAVAVSQSLPLRAEEFTHDECLPFFGGLLPEGGVRTAVARRLGVSERNDFALLDTLGGDVAGAVVIEPSHGPPRSETRGVRWFESDDGLAGWLAELPARPFHAGESPVVRLSLAGAQNKAPLRFDGERYGVPLGGEPSTHIVKLPIEGFHDTVANEAACLRFVSRLGLAAVEAAPDRRGGVEFLRVVRYDRDERGERLHQEDMCQALGFPPGTKYEAEGGPGVGRMVALLRAVASRPAVSTRALLDWVVAGYLIGNADGHAKNVSLLYRGRSTGLAPGYDILCTAIYEQHATRLALRIGGESRPERIERRHWERFVDDAGFGRAYLRRIAELAEKSPAAVRDACGSVRNLGWDGPVLDEIEQVVVRRSARVLETLA